MTDGAQRIPDLMRNTRCQPAKGSQLDLLCPLLHK